VTSAIISIAAAVVVYWLKRKLAKAEDERQRLIEKLHEIDSAIADGDESGVNALLDAALRMPSDAGRRDPGR
jgi:uncharacterized membrane protein YvbJ